MNTPTRVETEIDGKQVILETGKFANQANGAVTCQIGETMVLVTAVMGKEIPELGYFPLSVEYETRTYAAGKIKGSRFVKREGRSSDEDILSARLVDRGIRPLFPESFMREVQIIVTILAYDGENNPDVAATIAASAALHVSDIPFAEPTSGVRVAHVDDKYIAYPTHEEVEKSDIDLIVSGKKAGVMMVEAGANIVSEETVLGGITKAQEIASQLCGLQDELREKAGKEKAEFTPPEKDQALWDAVWNASHAKFEEMYATVGKVQRNEMMSSIKEELPEMIASYLEGVAEEERDAKTGLAKDYAYEQFDTYVREQIMTADKRFEGRGLDQIRDISVEVGVLPRVHGSGIFQRGETQVMSVATLGAPGLEQIIDGLDPEYKKHYLHHYNFPGYSVGETSRPGWPSRREIGHGMLAERALVPVLPERTDFPYVIRVVSEVMEANGSTSMASTCGSTLSLMDAGVPLKAPVAGIAMGLIMNEDGQYKVLTDIQGEEDHLGDMDFKVTGTQDGVTAMQMDIKVDGITKEIFEDALTKAKAARLTILEKMTAVIPEPRKELSEYAPRVVSLQIDTDKIKDVIGKGGEMINKIIDETGVEMNIEDDGRVDISSADADGLERAVQWVKDLTRKLEPGEIFDGEVTRVEDFGAFVRVLPGQEGLVHVSQVSDKRIENLHEVVKVGDKMKVMVVEIDDKGRLNLSRQLAIAKLNEQKKK